MAQKHNNMTYRELQVYNKRKLSTHRLDKERKCQGLINRGWSNVIELYKWIAIRLQELENCVEASILESFTKMQSAASIIKATVENARKRSQTWNYTKISNNISEFRFGNSNEDPNGNVPVPV